MWRCSRDINWFLSQTQRLFERQKAFATGGYISMRTRPGYIQRIFERRCEIDSDYPARKRVAA